MNVCFGTSSYFVSIGETFFAISQLCWLYHLPFIIIIRGEKGWGRYFFLRLFFKYSLTFDLHISFIIYSYKRQFNVSPTFSYWVSLHYFGVCHMFNRPGQNICIFDYCWEGWRLFSHFWGNIINLISFLRPCDLLSTLYPRCILVFKWYVCY